MTSTENPAPNIPTTAWWRKAQAADCSGGLQWWCQSWEKDLASAVYADDEASLSVVLEELHEVGPILRAAGVCPRISEVIVGHEDEARRLVARLVSKDAAYTSQIDHRVLGQFLSDEESSWLSAMAAAVSGDADELTVKISLVSGVCIDVLRFIAGQTGIEQISAYLNEVLLGDENVSPKSMFAETVDRYEAALIGVRMPSGGEERQSVENDKLHYLTQLQGAASKGGSATADDPKVNDGDCPSCVGVDNIFNKLAHVDLSVSIDGGALSPMIEGLPTEECYVNTLLAERTILDKGIGYMIRADWRRSISALRRFGQAESLIGESGAAAQIFLEWCELQMVGQGRRCLADVTAIPGVPQEVLDLGIFTELCRRFVECGLDVDLSVDSWGCEYVCGPGEIGSMLHLILHDSEESGVAGVVRLGDLADAGLRKSSLMRTVAAWARALQLVLVVRRGRFEYAKRVGTYARKLALKHVSYPDKLISRIDEIMGVVEYGLGGQA